MSATTGNPSASASQATAAAEAGASHRSDHHAPHAHHLKYGDVEIAGFAPQVTASDCDTEAEDEQYEEQQQELEDTSKPNKQKHDRKHRQKVRGDLLREQLDAEARRIHATRRYLFRRPRPLQYFRGTVLVRDNSERSSGRLELFFDLTFVGIIAVLAKTAVTEATGAAFVQYILTYTAIYMIWHWMREMFDGFYKDDFTQRILVLFVMACLILFGNNAISVGEDLSQSPARAVTIGSYLVAEAAIYATWIGYSFYIKAYRAQIRAHALVWLITVGLMIGAIFTSVRAAIALAVVAMVLEWHAWVFFYSPMFKRMMKLRYSSAIAIEHEIERYNDFFTIVMGEFVYSLFDGSPAGIGFHIRAGKAIMALMIAFCFQLFYMNGAGSKQITHPLRKSILRALCFFTLHLPIVSALTLCGDALADFIKEDRVSSGVRYMACEAFAVGTICLWLLAMIEYERDAPGELWLPKWARLMPRLLMGIVAIFLPLTHQAEGPAEGGESELGMAEITRRAIYAVGAMHEGMSTAETEEEIVPAVGFSAGADMTTGKLLGVMTAMIFFTLLWETITALDGPNATEERASDHLIERAKTHNGIIEALSTPEWRGYPHFFEPGVSRFDRTHQRVHHDQLSSQITRESTNNVV